MSEFITHSREETVALGERLAQHLAPGALIAFTGGLGAGKTAFCEGLAKGLGCTDPVSSPTFAIVNYYRGPRPFAHFDLYRISTENDLCAAGFYDYLDEGAVVAAEWSENFAWHWKTPSASTSSVWTTPPAASPSRGQKYEHLSRGYGGQDAGRGPAAG